MFLIVFARWFNWAETKISEKVEGVRGGVSKFSLFLFTVEFFYKIWNVVPWISLQGHLWMHKYTLNIYLYIPFFFWGWVGGKSHNYFYLLYDFSKICNMISTVIARWFNLSWHNYSNFCQMGWKLTQMNKNKLGRRRRGEVYGPTGVGISAGARVTISGRVRGYNFSKKLWIKKIRNFSKIVWCKIIEDKRLWLYNYLRIRKYFGN